MSDKNNYNGTHDSELLEYLSQLSMANCDDLLTESTTPPKDPDRVEESEYEVAQKIEDLKEHRQ